MKNKLQNYIPDNSLEPNVILIMTDQQRFDTLSCMGNKIIETPTLDWLAEEGTLFKNAYTPSPSCIPARACLFTGKKPWKNGVLGMGSNQLELGVNLGETIPKFLSRKDYHTQGIGKMHFYPQRSLNGFHNTILDESGREKDINFVSDYQEWFNKNKPADIGFFDHGLHWNGWDGRPYHLEEYLHPTVWTTTEGINFIKKRDPSKPFFLNISYARPHSPYDAPKFYYDSYFNKEYIEPVIGDWVSNETEQKVTPLTAWNSKLKSEQIKRMKAGYYGNITFLDHQIGRLLNYLRENNLFNNSLIIFTSDHGDMMGDHNLLRKTYAYEGSSHIPMIVKLPKDLEVEAKNKIVNKEVLLQDIFPTILDVLGEDIPDDIDGKSMFKLIKGENIEREWIHGEHSTCYSPTTENHYIVQNNMKYIYFPRREENSEQLFDLIKDPYENKNLIKDPEYTNKLIEMKRMLVTELEERGENVVKDGKLMSLLGKPFIASPHYEERLKTNNWNWLNYGSYGYKNIK